MPHVVNGAGGSGSGSVTLVGSNDGTIGVNNPSTIPDLTVLSAPLIQASWPIGICRIFAIDAVNGNDTNKGYADPTTSSTTDYAIACAAAGTVAKKTFAGLSKIFPRSGASRTCELVIANGGINTLGTYGESLESAIGGTNGYAILAVRATGTNTTAGCTAFDGSVADCTYQGAITATGMNAAGYNPTGTPTTTVVQVLQVGSGAPGFAAEAAGTMPLGANVRFDANTTTVALRNVRRQVIKVAGTDTLTFPTVLPAVPVASDVFYIEMPGVSLLSIFLGGAPELSSAALTSAFMTLSGLSTTGAMNFQGGLWRLSFCWSGTSISGLGLSSWSGTVAYTHPVRGTITTGSSRTGTSFSMINCGAVANTAFHTVTSYTITSCQTHSALSGVVIGSSVTVTNLLQGSAALFGGTGVIASLPPRILLGQLSLTNVSVGLGQIAINNPSGNGIFVNGAFSCLDLGIAGANISITGTVAIGLNLASGTPAPTNTRIVINNVSVPNFTTGFPILVSFSSIISFTQAQAGFTDGLGNVFFSALNNGVAGYKFSGKYFGGAGADFTYVADTLPSLITVNNNARIGYPAIGNMPANLRVKPSANNKVNATTFTVYKNGTATALTLSVPGGSTAMVKNILVLSPLFVEGDEIDLRVDSIADVGTSITFAAMIGYPATG